MGPNTENITILKHKADNVCRYNVKLRRVYATNFAVEKQQLLHIVSVYL